jgi:hypothetical protein
MKFPKSKCCCLLQLILILADLGTDYRMGLIHDVGDYDLIPKDAQQKIHDYAKEEFVQVLLDYLKKNIPMDEIFFSLEALKQIAGSRDLLNPIFNRFMSRILRKNATNMGQIPLHMCPGALARLIHLSAKEFIS